MIEILDVIQGSPEWHAARLGLPTASEFAAIMAKGQGKTRRSYLLKLAAERLTGEVQETYTSRHMDRGRELEAEAREYYALVTGCEEPQRVGFIKNEVCGCSPDALIGDDGVLEIKTRLPALMVEVMLAGEIPSEHKAQVQGTLWLTDRRWCDLVCYWPGMPIFIARAERDEMYIAELANEVCRFAAELNEVVQRLAMAPA